MTELFVTLSTYYLIGAGENSVGELLFPSNGLSLVTHEPNSVNTAPGPHIRGKTLKAYSLGDKEADLLLPGTGRYLLIVSQ